MQEIRTELNEQMEDLRELCKPLIEYLHCKYEPYTEICISSEGIKVKQTVIGIPDEKAVNDKANCLMP